jgi:beta-barrel assembly-enhancing protease
MMKRFAAILLSALLTLPASVVGSTEFQALTAEEFIKRPYLDLLELEQIPEFSGNEIQSVENQLNKEKKAEAARLKKDEERIEKELKEARAQLDQLNKKGSRDDSKAAEQRRTLQCRIVAMESEHTKVKTEREHGLPIVFQNKYAKLELLQEWPGVREAIIQKMESGRARERRYGDVEDIGIRTLGIDDLARKQQDDIKTGQDAIREMQSQKLMPPEVEDKEVIQYVQNISESIASGSDLRIPIKVTLLDSMEINAFALPGGFLYVNTGLINKAETESELVGVIAHETAHAAARHGARLMKRATIANIIYQAAQIGAVIVTGGAVGIGAYYALQYGFYGLGMIVDLSPLGVSRDYEAEADQLGAQYAWNAGYDPRGFITFFDKMANEDGYARGASFFRTHPPFIERIISTFSEITYLPSNSEQRVDSSGFIHAKERVAELIRKREAEETNKPTLRGKPAIDCGDIKEAKPLSD